MQGKRKSTGEKKKQPFRSGDGEEALLVTVAEAGLQTEDEKHRARKREAALV